MATSARKVVGKTHAPPRHHEHEVERKVDLLIEITARLLQYQHIILKGISHIMATQAEAAGVLRGVQQTLGKISGETADLLKKVQDLQDAAGAAGDVGTDLQAAIDAVADQAKKVDEMVPDAVDSGTGGDGSVDTGTGDGTGSDGATSPSGRKVR